MNVNVCIVQRKNSKTWSAKLDWKGADGKWHSKNITTGIEAPGNKRAAKKKAIEIRDKFADKLERTENNPDKDWRNNLFADFLNMWLDVHKKTRNLRQSTIDSYQTALDSSICPYFKKLNVSLTDLSTGQIQGYYDSLLKKGLSGNTVRHHHCYINTALKYAIKHGYISKNPINIVEIPPKKKSDKKAFTPEQLSVILKAVKGKRIEIPVLLSVYCGLRRSEVLGLEWSDVDMVNRIIHVRKTRTRAKREIFEEKTKSEASTRDLPFDDDLAEVLRLEQERQHTNRLLFKDSYDTSNNFVCVWEDGKPLKCDYISDHFKLELKKIGIEDKGLTFHSLRHTTGTIMANSGNVSLRIENSAGIFRS